MSNRVVRALTIGFTLVAFAGCDAEGEENLVEVRSAPDMGMVDGSWIVVFKDGTHASARAREIATQQQIAVGHTYEHALQGFSFRGSEQAAARIAALPDVDYVEPDQIATIVGKPGGVGGGGGGGGGQVVPWGVARVNGGVDCTGKTAWVIDSGVDLDHPDLIVDADRSVAYISGGKNTPDDGNGHGTHVAGTIAAVDNSTGVIGVCAGATVVAVRVLGNSGSGSYSDVIAGVDYVAANGNNGDVANMSLGGPVSTALDDAVKAAAATGVKFALAAGNESDHANNHSPARANGNNIYTVSAYDINDTWAYFSNYGM
ncbi:MAG: S8 family serine peptidase, partial [Planctomycetales bacterium]|nr:S8 family serine peptidase [Planctomycetales bacterium]